ncbi:MAG: serine/threonine protein kinase, partial [Candidatus Solibacter usitatus]|nr:serine/threonine protein kinase [Candidatus Solibacter usitatus]
MAEALAPGQMLSHYRIERRLGAGGMGEVYLAHDNALERTVALKVLPAELAQDAERLRRFTQEAKAASAINHPNVATIYKIGEAAGLRFIAMEYVAGQTLAARSWNCAEIIGVAVQVADALDAAHTQGVVHRDLKPANIMLAGHDRVKVLDFGLAKMV